MRWTIISLLWLAGCDSCSSSTQVEGPHPYIRCMLGDQAEGEWRWRELNIRAEDHTLHVRGLTEFAAFVATEKTPSLLEDVDETLPLFVLGGFAVDEEGAKAFLDALDDRIAFLLPGGRDAPDVMDVIRDSGAHIVDLRGVHTIITDFGTFIVVSGAPDGRYALGENRCGYGANDIKRLAESLDDEPSSARYWLSWASPRGDGEYAPDLGFGGIHVGDERLQELSQNMGIQGGLVAWPTTQAGRISTVNGQESAANQTSHDLFATVIHLGEEIERWDGTRAPSGFLWVKINDEGLHVSPRPL